MDSFDTKYIQQNSAKVLNQQQHIDSIEDPNLLESLLQNTELPKTESWAYSIPHYHFKLKPGETLLADFYDSAGIIEIRAIDLTKGNHSELYPVQYFSNGAEYVPVMFTNQPEKACILPDGALNTHDKNLGICSQHLIAKNCHEFTYENERVQILRQALDSESKSEATTDLGEVGEPQAQTKLTKMTTVRMHLPDGSDPDKWGRMTCSYLWRKSSLGFWVPCCHVRGNNNQCSRCRRY